MRIIKLCIPDIICHYFHQKMRLRKEARQVNKKSSNLKGEYRDRQHGILDDWV